MKNIFLLLLFTAFSKVYANYDSNPKNEIEVEVNRFISASQFYVMIGKNEKAEEVAWKAVDIANELENTSNYKSRVKENISFILNLNNKELGAITQLADAKKLYSPDKLKSYKEIALKYDNMVWKHIPELILNDKLCYPDDQIYLSQLSFNSGSIQFAKQTARYVKLLSYELKDKELEARSFANHGLQILNEKKASNYLDKSLYQYYSNYISSPEVKVIETVLKEKFPSKKTYIDSIGTVLPLPPLGLFAGIEVGSKGVKLSIIDVFSDDDGNYSYDMKKDSAINTEFISFTDKALLRSVEAVHEFYEIAQRRFTINTDKACKISIAISSGVLERATADNKLDMIAKLQDAIRRDLGLPNLTIEAITPKNEAKLTHIGVIKSKDRFRTMLIDLGSGNTKGGFFYPDSPNFIDFGIPWGTGSIAKDLEKDKILSISEFATAADMKLADIRKNQLYPEVQSRSGLRNLQLIVMSGGICWAIASYLHPEKASNAYIELTAQEVSSFKLLLVGNYIALIDPQNHYYKVKTEAEKEKINKIFARVGNVFDQKNLIAGTTLLETIMKEFDSTSVKHRYYLSNYGYIGWITGYIIQCQGAER